VNATEVVWWVFAVATVATAMGVVFSRSVIHSAIFLIGSLGGVGAMYVILTVEFLALVQFLIYGGAVTVLILLALMLTRQSVSGEPEKVTGVQAPFGILVGGLLLQPGAFRRIPLDQPLAAVVLLDGAGLGHVRVLAYAARSVNGRLSALSSAKASASVLAEVQITMSMPRTLSILS